MTVHNPEPDMTPDDHALLERPETPTEEVAAACEAARAGQDWWQRQWLAFPSVSRDAEGGYRYWDVPADSGVFSEDWALGEDLARGTLAQMRRFPEGSSVLRRALKQMDLESAVAQGFLNHLEERLAGSQAAS